MRRMERFDFKLILFILFLCLKCFISCGNMKILPNDVVSDLYLKYVEAVSDGIFFKHIFVEKKMFFKGLIIYQFYLST